MTASQEHQVYAFDRFYLDTKQRLLFTSGGERVPLTSRAFDALLFLVEHPGELLETDTLMKAIWSNITVEENNLQQIITALRRALGEKPEDHKFIVTSRGQGYRFVAPVHAAILSEESTPSAAWSGRVSALWASAILVLGLLLAIAFYLPVVLDRSTRGADAKSVTVTAIPSVAVLPFADLSPDGDQAYFSRGIAEELLNQLARLNGLRVAGRTSSFSLAGSDMDVRSIGEALGVGHVLQGSVRKDGDRVRISAQLIDTSNGYQLWSKTFERQLGDIFAIQDEIARAVAGALSIALDIDARNRLQGAGTRNFEAYDNYLAATDFLRNGSDLPQAVIYLQRAIKMDPNYAAAWAALALAYGQSAWRDMGEGMKENLQKLGESAARAVQLDPGLADGYVMLGQFNVYRANWSVAEQDFNKAISLADAANTHGAYATYLARTGRMEAARAHMNMALDRDPIHPLNLTWRALIETAQGHIDEALDDIRRCEELGYPAESLVGNRLIIALNSKDPEAVKHYFEAASALGTTEAPLLRSLLRDFGSRDRALSDLHVFYADTTRHGPGTRSYVALLAAYFGDPNFALKVMSEEVRQNKARMVYLWFPVFSDMRRLEEFKALMRDLNLVDYWKDQGWPDVCHPAGNDDFSCN